MKIPCVKLADGNEMPVFGLGTWQLTGKNCEHAVKNALEIGYSHIDTAHAYGNHKEIGNVLSSFSRKKIFLASKIWMTDYRRNDVLESCEKALKDLKTDFLDLYLIHWPLPSVPFEETLGALGTLVEQGKVKSIGISNFSIAETEEALRVSPVPIATNQVEFHPHLFQKVLLDYCKKKKIVLTAYSPLGRGKIFSDSVLLALAEKYKKTVAQVCLRWELQKGIVVIPKASSSGHLRENFGVFGWKLSRQDEKQIDSIQEKERIVNPSFAHFAD